MIDKKQGLVGNRYGAARAQDGKLRLGGVSYLNARPVMHGLLQDLAGKSFRVSMAEPAELARQLFEEELDAALAPVAALATHGGLQILPHVGICCDGAVESVVLLAERPVADLETILIDRASRTSVTLLRVLLNAWHPNRTFQFHSCEAATIPSAISAGTGALMIGDAARQARGDYALEVDLGSAWKELTGLPFVFAAWAAWPHKLLRSDVDVIHASLEAGLKARAAIAAMWTSSHGGTAADHERYLTERVHYRLTDEATAGLNEFLDRASALSLLPPHRLTFWNAPRTNTTSVDSLLQKGAEGDRLSFADAMRLGQEAPTQELGLAADLRRQALHPEGVVSYIVDRNINYTNVCTTSCKFCAFYRPVGHREGYVLSREALAEKIRETVEAGGIQILLQGGLNPELELSWYEDLFRWMTSEFPIALHALSPEEIWHLSRLENLPLREILRRLQEAGMASLPGGGAEVLTDRVRRKIARAKCTSAEWLECMRVAHTLGMRSTATMMFGTTDTLLDRVAHLLKVRELQDETDGFTAFICWDYQHEQGTRATAGETGAVQYLRTQALGRLVLDNVKNVQTSWVTQGPQVGQVALRYGANDMGSVMFEENVVSSAGTTFGMDAQMIEQQTRAAGFRVVRRNMQYSWLDAPA